MSSIFTKIRSFITWLFYSLWWCFLALVDAIILVCKSDSRYHRYVKSYYIKKVKPRLTNGPSSRTSYSANHGFFYVIAILFFIGATICYYVFSTSTVKTIKTKIITITLDSQNKGELDGLNLFLTQDWEVNKNSADQAFQLWFYFSKNIPDSVKFRVDIETNFDMKLQSAYHHNVMDSLCSERHSIFNLGFDSEELAQYTMKSDSRILNDLNTPYVNLYVRFIGIQPQWLNISETDSTLSTSTLFDGDQNQIWIKLWSQWDNEKEDADVMPFELLSVKPEPVEGDPFTIAFDTPEKLKEVYEKGIYVSVVNRKLEANMERIAFMQSVIIGAIVSLILTLILKLLEKWKDLNNNAGVKDPFESE